MSRKDRNGIYFKHLILMATVNKVRIVLTSIGLFVSVLIFAIGIVFTNSYYEKNIGQIEEIRKFSIAIKYDSLQRQHLTDLINFIGSNPTEDIMLVESKAIMSKEIEEGIYCNIMATVHGVNTLYDVSPLVSSNNNMYIPSKTILKEGRLFSSEDIYENSHVAIIDEITARLLFPSEDAIGKTITIGTGINGSCSSEEQSDYRPLNLKIIGVIESNSIVKENLMVLMKNINQSQENVYFDTQIYCPISVFDECFKGEETLNHMIFSLYDQASYDRAKEYVDAFVVVKENAGVLLSSITYENQKAILEDELQSTRSILNIITMFLCIVSGISIMSIVFFSVKERIPEVGIRKAFGATSMDILVLFVFEMVFIGFLTSLVATCLSIILAKVISLYLYEKMMINFPICIEMRHMLLPILLGVLEAVICSIPPGLYAAKIEVTKALRFE